MGHLQGVGKYKEKMADSDEVAWSNYDKKLGTKEPEK